MLQLGLLIRCCGDTEKCRVRMSAARLESSLLVRFKAASSGKTSFDHASSNC